MLRRVIAHIFEYESKYGDIAPSKSAKDHRLLIRLNLLTMLNLNLHV